MEKRFKKTENQPDRQNLNLFVFQQLKAGLNPSKISKRFDIPLTRISYHISSLIKKKIVKKVGYGTYEILEKSIPKQVQMTTRDGTNNPSINLNLFKPDSVRGHAFQFTLSINPNLRNWEKREELLKKMGIVFKPLKLYGGAQSLEFKGRKVWLTRKSIIVYEKSSYMANNSREARKYAVHDFLSFIEALERYLKADFGATRQDRLKFKVSKQHYALIKNALAKQYDKEGKKLEVSNEKGQWFIIDNSFNLHEAETIHPQTAVNDNEKVQNFFNGLKEYEGFTPKFVVNSLGVMAQNQQVFGENLKSHIKSVQDLGTGTIKLSEEVENLSSEVRTLNKIVAKLEETFQSPKDTHKV